MPKRVSFYKKTFIICECSETKPGEAMPFDYE